MKTMFKPEDTREIFIKTISQPIQSGNTSMRDRMIRDWHIKECNDLIAKSIKENV